MKKVEEDKRRAAQLYGSNRTIDVSEKSSVEIIEFEQKRRNEELDRLRQELEELYKLTETSFAENRSLAEVCYRRTAVEVLHGYCRKLLDRKLSEKKISG